MPAATVDEARRVSEAVPSAPAGSNGVPPRPEPVAFHFTQTESFVSLLKQLGISLLVTTYQAGKVVGLRADGGVLNTHFRSFPKPMGLALRGLDGSFLLPDADLLRVPQAYRASLR